MATITIKALPDKLHRQLKARALQQHRSLNSHLITILEAATTPRRLSPESMLARARKLRERVGGRLTDDDLAASRNAGRR